MALPTLSGTARLIDDPELRFTPTGQAVCKVRLAFNSRRKNETTGEWEDADVFFVDGTVWRQEAENVAESLQRGLEVCVVGRLKTRKYETKEGEKRSVVELMVDSIGPTLKYATARIQKMQRSSNGDRQPASGGFDDPWATAAPTAKTADDSRTSGFDVEPPF